MKNGYWQKLLRIDLTTRTCTVEPIAVEELKAFIGGAGLAAEILRRETPARQDPYGAGNRLIFATGAFQGPPVPGGAKFSVVSISPLTGTFGDSAAGASWGPSLKDAGYDVLVVQGAADKPVYVNIADDKVEIIDAASLWGLDSFETVDAVRKLAGAKASIAAIGPAGERKVATACIVFDKHSFAGRCGLGAVMGAKNLKAVAVQGTRSVETHDAEAVRTLIKQFQLEIGKFVRGNDLRLHGTPGLCVSAEAIGDMPIKYWDGDVWPEGAKKLGGASYTDGLQAKPLPCRNCPIGCHRQITIEQPAKYALKTIGPEYETLGMMGTNLMIDDPKAVAMANEIANRLGVDTISTGAMIGFAMECYEKGWVTVKDTGGLKLDWGSHEALIKLTELIGKREGFGAIFAEGTLGAAGKIGPHAVESVVHVKGLDLPAHDPRSCFSLAPSYATSTRGACHFRGPCEDIEMGGFTMPEVGIDGKTTTMFHKDNQGMMASRCQDLGSLANSLVVCLFTIDGGGWALAGVRDLFNAITGWDYTVEDMLLAGERGFISQRLMNIRDGYGAKSDVLPKKMYKAASQGKRAGQVPPLADMLRDYYEVRGWDSSGVPTDATLARLGLKR